MKLTWSSLAYRSVWELDRRSGFKALRTPRGRVPIPSSVPSFADWYAALGGGHRLRRLLDAPPRLLWEPGGGPDPLDWHLEPHSGQHWPSREHWTQAVDAKVGDLRLTWERNRFAHVWEWLAEGGGDADAFAAQIADWRRNNAFRSGVNWASGQELAIRSLAWLAGAAAFGEQLSDAVWQDLTELLYWHGVHIESEFSFAQRAVRNNHVIAEALGLAAIGDAFSCFDEANRWRARGLAVLKDAVTEQFFDDGGYCQCSHAYHHFALQLAIEAWEWFDELHETLEPVFERSVRYFESIMEGGRVCNFGPNDRVLAPRFDALLTALRQRIGQSAQPAPPLATFPQAGLHVLREGATMATLRCGELPDRAGHDDGLHIEIWFDGEPVTTDAGSFLYHGPWTEWFAGARSHNVCLVGSREPRERLARFTWDRITHPWLVELEAPRMRALARYDTAFDGVTWERELRLSDGEVEVYDTLNALNGNLHVFQLHWLLDAPPDQVDTDGSPECFTWNISTPRATVQLLAEPLVGTIEAPQLLANGAFASQTYGQRRLVTSALLRVTARAVRFTTRFQRP